MTFSLLHTLLSPFRTFHQLAIYENSKLWGLYPRGQSVGSSGAIEILHEMGLLTDPIQTYRYPLYQNKLQLHLVNNSSYLCVQWFYGRKVQGNYMRTHKFDETLDEYENKSSKTYYQFWANHAERLSGDLFKFEVS